MSKLSFDLTADMDEENGNLVEEINVPEIDPNRFDISVEGECLHVHGSREEKSELKDKDYYEKEIKRGEFSRKIQLPTAVVATKVTASYSNGVLKIIMPKKQEQETSRVKVSVVKN